MPTVPIRPQLRQTISQQQGQSTPPPNDVYAMMAASAMHSEGRLLAQPDGGIGDKLNSIPTSAKPSR